MTGIARVHYRERQRLLVADLQAEQGSRLGGMGRHLITHHQWGIVRGLDLVSSDEGWVLEPGVAVDGYGREIVVSERAFLADGDTPSCWTVLLYYCEAPPPRICRPRPPDRLAGDYRVVLVVEAPGALDEWLDLSAAQAAGPMSGLPPWPVTLGRVGRCEGDQIAATAIARYTRARADDIRSPSGRATLQLGLQSATDLYHVLLSTANSPTLSKRLGVNRDGTVHVWRGLVLTGPRAVAQATSSTGVTFKIATVMPSGIGRVLSVDGTLVKAAGRPSFNLALHDTALPQPVTHAHVFTSSILNPALLSMPGAANLNLEVAGRPAVLKPFRARARAAAREEPQEPIEVTTAEFSATLSAAGGHFKVERAERDPGEEMLECGDIARTHSAPHQADEGIVVVKPAAEATLDPDMRGYHTLESKVPGQAPSTELRVLGGAFDKTDASRRIAWGGRFGGGWDPVLSMDGMGRFTAPGAKGDTRLLVKDGAMHLPPVAAQPTDQLFQDLQILAFIAGLKQVGRVKPDTEAKINLTVPASQADGAAFAYSFTYPLKDPSWFLKRFIVVIQGTGGVGDVILHSTSSALATITASIDPFRHRASAVQVGVAAWYSADDKDWMVESPVKNVPVTH